MRICDFQFVTVEQVNQLRAEALIIEQQRDYLLAALKWAIKQMPEPSLSGPYFDGYKIAKEAIDKADLTQ